MSLSDLVRFRASLVPFCFEPLFCWLEELKVGVVPTSHIVDCGYSIYFCVCFSRFCSFCSRDVFSKRFDSSIS